MLNLCSTYNLSRTLSWISGSPLTKGKNSIAWPRTWLVVATCPRKINYSACKMVIKKLLNKKVPFTRMIQLTRYRILQSLSSSLFLNQQDDTPCTINKHITKLSFKEVVSRKLTTVRIQQRSHCLLNCKHNLWKISMYKMILYFIILRYF